MSEIAFRASGIGNLMVEGRGVVLTDNQLQTLNDFEERIRGNGKPLTEKQRETYLDLKARKNAPPQLSDTAKRFIESMWLLNQKGFYEDLQNKQVSKGLLNEDDGLGLVSEVEGEFYIKNKVRITKGNITGECDVDFVKNGVRIIKDIKSSWSPKTFMAGDLNTIYEWQGRAYMHLYDADEFHLHYTLTDCPQHLYEQEVWKLRNRYNIIDPDEESVKPLFDQLRRNLIFSDNPAYTVEERVKTFKIYRDKEKEQKLLDKIAPALEYYHSIKLNQV
jgi:hypothetical protein